MHINRERPTFQSIIAERLHLLRAVTNGEFRIDSIWWLSTPISLMKLTKLLGGDICEFSRWHISFVELLIREIEVFHLMSNSFPATF